MQASLAYWRHHGRVAALVAVAGLLAVLAPAVSAYALSPHTSGGLDASNCAACHSTHESNNELLLRADVAKDDISAACLACHDGSDGSATDVAGGPENSFGLESGHSLTSASTDPAHPSGCATCHEVHGSQTSTRMIPVHQVNGKAVSSAGKSLCLACHDSENSWADGPYPSTAEPQRDAIGYPVSGTWTGPTTYSSGTNAHRLIPETTQTVGQSDPVRREQGDCRYCHAAHRGSNAYDGLETTFTVPMASTLVSDQEQGAYAAQCFECHGGAKPSGFTTATVDIRRYVTSETTSAGHRIVTAGGTLPVGAPLPCFECHNPHGSTRGNASMLSDERGGSLETSTPAGVRAFCFTCHTTSDTVAGWDSEDATLAPVPAGAEVVGLPREGANLRLSSIDGHRADDTASCYQCHGDSYAAGGRNVHNPGDGHGSDLVSSAVGTLKPSLVASSALDASVSVDASGSADASGALDATTSVEATVSPAWSGSSDSPTLPLLPTEPAAVVTTVGGWLAARRKGD